MNILEGKMFDDRPHPSPLPQERENRTPASRVGGPSPDSFVFRFELPKSGDGRIGVQTIEDDQRLFPLPGGEGQGEGERHH